ncbi:MAG: hypothetical protein P1V97_09720 [Planctomycetota bacterium]|nr:hypothetical protein [Planctomycetota bacterium]
MSQHQKSQKTTQYVLCFGQASYDRVPSQILLVRKPPKSLHEGLLNLPGGWVLEHYTQREMALREMHLETGLEGRDPERIGQVFGQNYVMEVWRMIVPVEQALRPEPDQPAQWIAWLELKDRTDVLPQLLVIAPLAMAGLKGWTLTDKEHCINERRYQGLLSWSEDRQDL